MIFAVVFLGMTVVALVWLHDRTDKRVHEERKGWQLERANLMQRVQAPQVAVMDHSAQQHTSPGMAHSLTDEEAARLEHEAQVLAGLEQDDEYAKRLL